MKNNIPEKLIKALGFKIEDLNNYYVNFKNDNEIIINVYPKNPIAEITFTVNIKSDENSSGE